jgi:eukaryotic-like serine/threonine-protein kinase
MAAATPDVGLRLKRYSVHDRIGAGGMGMVHLGRAVDERGLARVVAIKRLHPHLLGEPEVVAAFGEEARICSHIRHPNVVGMLEVAVQDGEIFLVMEYVEGAAVSSMMGILAARGEVIPAAVAVGILRDTLHGLHAAHEARSDAGTLLNIVHRDVSPANILVGVDGVARVTDFGVAKAIGQQQTTRDGRIKGKLGYMAPEQLAGRAVTRKTDLFAAAVVLWELLTGERLFRADADAETITRVLFEPVRAPSHVRSSISPSLDAVLLRALERDPTRRFATAEEMTLALETALPPASAQTIGQWVRTMAEDELDERARSVAALERVTGPSNEGATESSDSPSAPTALVGLLPTQTPAIAAFTPRRRARIAIITSFALAGSAFFLVQSLRRGRLIMAPREPDFPRMSQTSAPATAAASAIPVPASVVPISTAPLPPSSATVLAQPPTNGPASSTAPARGTSIGVHGQQVRALPRSRSVAVPTGSARERLYSRD